MWTFRTASRLVLLLCIMVCNADAGPLEPSLQTPRYANASTSLPVASGNCGKCGIEAPGGVQLVYWQPDAARNQSKATATVNQPYTLVENGFTFTSPSVYVVYSSLRATVTCDSSNLDTTGPSFEAKTIGYSSRFLAFGTLEIPGPNCNEYVVAGGFHTIDFADLYNNPITTTTMYKPGCPPYANPRLSLPAELTSVDPAWANCEPLFYGAFDPPRFLKKASGGMAPQAPSQPTAMAAGDAAMSEHPAAQATPAPVTPAPTATAAGSPLDPSQQAAAPAQVAGPPSPPQPPQALPANPNTPANAAQAAPASAQQSTPGVPDPGNLSPDQMSQLHQVLQSTPPAKSVQPQVNPAVPAVKSGDNSALAVPFPAPGSSVSSIQQAAQVPDVAPKLVPGSQSVPATAPVPAPVAAAGSTPALGALPSVPGEVANAAHPVAAQTQNDGVPPLVKPGNGAAKGGNAESSNTVGSVGPAPAPAQSMAKPQNGPSPVLVDPKNGALVEASPNSPFIPASVQAYATSPISGSQTSASPDTGKSGNLANPADGVLGEANSNSPSNPGGAQRYSPVIIAGSQESAIQNVGKSGIAGNAGSGALVGGSSNDVVYAAPNLANAQPTTAPYQSKANGYPADAGAPNGGVNVDVSGPTKGSNANGIGNSDTATGGPGAPAPLVIDGKTVHKASDGALLVAGKTVSPGIQATLSSAIISLDSSHVIIDDTTHAYLPIPSKTATPLIVNGKPVQPLSDGGLLIAGQTLVPGSQATMSGAVISVDSGNMIVDGVTHALPSKTETPLIVNGKTAKVLSDGGLLIAGQTLAPGSQATVSGAVVSVDSSNVIVDGITHAYLPVPTPTATPIIVDGKTTQILPDGASIIASQTLTPGTQATVAGAVLSVGAGNFVVDGTTHALSPPPTESPTPLLIAGQAVQKASDGTFIVGSMTVTQGSQATIAGHVVSVGASALVIDASTHSIPPNTISFDSTPLSIAGYAIQKASGAGGGLIIASRTTIPQGSVATISGTVISAGNNEVVLDGTTHALLPPKFTGTALPFSIPSIIYTSANKGITLTSGATFHSDGRVVTYTGSSVSVVTEATSAVSGTVTVAYQATSASSSEPAVIGGMIASVFGSGAAVSSGALLRGSGDPGSARVSGCAFEREWRSGVCEGIGEG